MRGFTVAVNQNDLRAMEKDLPSFLLVRSKKASQNSLKMIEMKIQKSGQVPVDTGKLRASSKIKRPKIRTSSSGFYIEQELTYGGTSGVDYAAAQYLGVPQKWGGTFIRHYVGKYGSPLRKIISLYQKASRTSTGRGFTGPRTRKAAYQVAYRYARAKGLLKPYFASDGKAASDDPRWIEKTIEKGRTGEQIFRNIMKVFRTGK